MKTHGRELETLARDAKEVESTAVKAEGDPFVPGRFGISWEDMGVNGIALHHQTAAVENHEVVKLNFSLQTLGLPAFPLAASQDFGRKAGSGQLGLAIWMRQSQARQQATGRGDAAHGEGGRHSGGRGQPAGRR